MASRLLAAVGLAIALVVLPGALAVPADAAHIPTTADLADAGPEHPAGGQYGDAPPGEASLQSGRERGARRTHASVALAASAGVDYDDHLLRVAPKRMPEHR